VRGGRAIRDLRDRTLAADGTHEGKRALAELGVRLGLDDVPCQHRRPADGDQLLGARRATGEVPRDRSRVGRVAGHEPFEAVRLRGRDLDALQRLSVIHDDPRARWRRP
jgi:hypothetical protein